MHMIATKLAREAPAPSWPSARLSRMRGRARHLGRRVSRRARQEHGITLIIMVIVMFVTSLLVAAAFSLARNEIHLSGGDTASKQAYYAALSGINNYAYHLNQEPNYLDFCTSPPVENKALNQYYKTGTESPLKASELSTARVPESGSERYAIQLVPAASAPKGERSCEKETHISESMIEEENSTTTGTFTILSTGFATAPNRSKPVERTVLATFRNLGFASFVYYTEYETQPPVLDGSSEAEPKCRQLYQYRPSYCTPVSFVSLSGMVDELKGPVHTEDHVSICNSPVFGRNSRDRIEFVDFLNESGDQGYSTEGQCSTAAPTFKGTKIPKSEVQSVTPPPNNKELELIAEEEAQEPYPSHFTGRTEITLEGQYMTVNDEGKAYSHIPFPKNGVVYVSTGTCKASYNPESATYSGEAGCGTALVKGEYSKSLTIGAQNSIIIDGSIKTPTTNGVPTTSALLGLIGNEYVRIYHPVESSGWSGCSNSGSAIEEYEIWAAILAVNDSFLVDNFNCGSPLGRLKIHGALAQIFRGPVGTFRGSEMASGYTKEYEYDERLRAAEPPHFLNPVQASWRIERETLSASPAW